MRIRRHPSNTLLAPFWSLWSNKIVPASIASSITHKYFTTKNTGPGGNGFEIVFQSNNLQLAEASWIAMCNDSAADSYLGIRDDVTAFNPRTQKLVGSLPQTR